MNSDLSRATTSKVAAGLVCRTELTLSWSLDHEEREHWESIPLQNNSLVATMVMTTARILLGHGWAFVGFQV